MWFRFSIFDFLFSIFILRFLLFVFRFRYQFGHLLWAMARPWGLSSMAVPARLRKCNGATFRGICRYRKLSLQIEAAYRLESESDWQLKSAAAFGCN